MLQMKSACERCSAPLTPGGEAAICSFECTFCADCATQMSHICPNCVGELVRRPKRVRSVASAAIRQVWNQVSTRRKSKRP